MEETMEVPTTERFPLLAMDREAGPSCDLKDAPTGPFRAEVIASSDMHWSTNALRFPTKEEALEYVENLARRWMLVTHWRVVQQSVPENQEYEPGSEDGSW
jgi:hypothetical protein